VISKHASPSGSCREYSPSKIAPQGRLYLWLSSGRSVQKVHGYLRDSGWPHQISEEDQCVTVLLKGEVQANLFDRLSSLLTAAEFEDAKALFKPGSEEVGVRDFPKVRPLRRLAALSRAQWLFDMVSEERLTSFFQPIVWSDEPAKIYAHECLLRGVQTDGSLIAPASILGLAKDSGTIFRTDFAARKAAIRRAAHLNVTDNLFINFTPAAVHDPANSLRTTIHAVDEADIPRENIVFEITETERTYDVLHLRSLIDHYRRFGFRIALDDVGSGYSSLNLIHQLRPDFIKLDMHLVRDIDQDPYKATITQKILEIAQKLDIKTVAEGIETTEELDWVRDHGADFAQGYLIAEPKVHP
jgi:EAL domain-containing protein (putative c-di-GMP-specific phosphodiesterase class I)